MEHRGRNSDIDAPSLSPAAGRGAGSGEGNGAEEEGEADGTGGQETGGQGPGAGGQGPGAGGQGPGPGTGGQGLVAVRAPLPGTFYRAPRPGAAPFAEVGSRVGADTVIGIVETMKLMNPVHAGVAGVVAEFCVGNAEFADHGAALLRIRADR